MANNAVATKGNLINTKKSLALAKVGYDLMDKKRNILIREMMTLIDKANEIQGKIDDAYSQAYQSLQTANITLGFNSARANSIPVENSLQLATMLKFRLITVCMQQTASLTKQDLSLYR